MSSYACCLEGAPHVDGIGRSVLAQTSVLDASRMARAAPFSGMHRISEETDGAK